MNNDIRENVIALIDFALLWRKLNDYDDNIQSLLGRDSTEFVFHISENYGWHGRLVDVWTKYFRTNIVDIDSFIQILSIDDTTLHVLNNGWRVKIWKTGKQQ